MNNSYMGEHVMKNLLLGNGINAHMGIEQLNISTIKERFEVCLCMNRRVFQEILGVTYKEAEFKKILDNAKNSGIETLTAEIYKYVWINTQKKRSINFEIRLLDILNCIALNSIFFENDVPVRTYNLGNVPKFEKYQKIFSLNYIEFWDNKRKSIHLHGTINYDNIKIDKRPIFIASQERCCLDEYKNIMNDLSKNYNIQCINTADIILVPECIAKQEAIGVGAYPSNDLYPADDLFPNEPKTLYQELEGIDTLEIFGMSPYGDKDLIRMINHMHYVKIYIYDLQNNEECIEWDKILKCPHEFCDSMDIMKH